MAKTHLISDESLGGIQREYVEVERKVAKGDIVHISLFNRLVCSEIRRVDTLDAYYDKVDGFLLDEAIGKQMYFSLHEDKCVILTPTNIVQIEGTRYRMVERKAVVGDKILAVQSSYGISIGGIYHVIDVHNSGNQYGACFKDDRHIVRAFWLTERYRVLFPLEESVKEVTVDTTQASPQVIDMLANLSQRIVALESETHVNAAEINKLARENEMLYEEIADLKSRESVNTLARDLAEFIAKEARKNGRG